MKLKKVLAGAAAFSLLFHGSAFAASIDKVEGNVAYDADRTVTISAVFENPEKDLQATLLVIPSNVDLALYGVSDIKYIKQTSAASEGKAEFSFSLKELDRTGSYTAYIGGTGLDAPAKFEFTFDKNTITIALQAPDTKNEITVSLYDKDGNAVGAAASVDGATGKYTYSLDNGVYTVKAGGNAILPFIKTVDISEKSAELGNVVLVSGDVNGDGSITLRDLEAVYASWLSSDANADVNGDGNVTLTDLEIIYKNWLATTDTAYNN